MDWQPIETFPKNEEEYLACDERIAGGFYQVVYWDSGLRRLCVPDAGTSYSLNFFTHWMLLPLVPPAERASPIPSAECKSE